LNVVRTLENIFPYLS